MRSHCGVRQPNAVSVEELLDSLSIAVLGDYGRLLDHHGYLTRLLLALYIFADLSTLDLLVEVLDFLQMLF